jgi:fatty-acyl-CoA synthase
MTPASHLLAAARAATLGVKVPERPDRLLRALLAMAPYRGGLLGGIAAAAARYPTADAVVTPTSRMTYGELWRQSGLLAQALTDSGVRPDQPVGLLARNGPFFVTGLLAVTRLGADVVLLNTAMAGPQLADVVATEGVRLVLHDDDLTAQALASTAIVWSAAWCAEAAAAVEHETGRPHRTGEITVLTSGTTGRPKGARRPSGGPGTLRSARAFAAALSWRVRQSVAVPAPFFHAWGLAGLLITLSLSGTVVTRPEFDAAGLLSDLADHRVELVLAVPVMLQRLLDLPPGQLARHDLGHLRGIVSSGSALPPHVTLGVLRRFGPVLYNVYGSTEVAVSTIARPADLERDPARAGRPAPHVEVRVLDADGASILAPGVTGRVFVGGDLRFRGYTSGDGRDVVDGLVSTGDLGHWDSAGHLLLDGREDDMIVSGGENVYPVEVEQLLATYPDVAEVAVAGRHDAEFGQALYAWVVVRESASISPEELRAFVRSRLASYKVPRTVTLTTELPRTASGKVMARSLA